MQCLYQAKQFVQWFALLSHLRGPIIFVTQYLRGPLFSPTIYFTQQYFTIRPQYFLHPAIFGGFTTSQSAQYSFYPAKSQPTQQYLVVHNLPTIFLWSNIWWVHNSPNISSTQHNHNPPNNIWWLTIQYCEPNISSNKYLVCPILLLPRTITIHPVIFGGSQSTPNISYTQ